MQAKGREGRNQVYPSIALRCNKHEHEGDAMQPMVQRCIVNLPLGQSQSNQTMCDNISTHATI